MTHYWATDHTAVSTRAEEAHALMVSRRDLHWYVFMDRAFDAGRPPLSWIQPQWPLYNDGRLARLLDVSPCLLQLSTRPDDLTLLALQRLLRHGSGRPMLSLLGSPADGPTLQKHWQSFLEATDDDEEALLLRWADTRCTAALLKLLPEADRQRLLTPLKHWLILDRAARWQALTPPDSSPAATLAPPVDTGSPALRWDVSQLDALIRAAEADTVLAAIHEHMPDALPPSSAQVHRLTEAACHKGLELGATQMADLMALTLCSIQTQGRGLDDPRLAAAWAGDPQERPGRLATLWASAIH